MSFVPVEPFEYIRRVFIKYNSYTDVSVRLIKQGQYVAGISTTFQGNLLPNSLTLSREEVSRIARSLSHAAYMAGVIDAHIYTQLAEAHNKLPELKFNP